MSEKREKRRRLNLRFEYIRDFSFWLDSEPPRWMFWRWRKWKRERPVWDDGKEPLWHVDMYWRD